MNQPASGLASQHQIPRPELKDRVHEYLQQHCRGKGQAILMVDLYRRVTGDDQDHGNMHSRCRAIRSVIKELRFKDHIPIGIGEPGGYYICTTEAELRESVERNLRRAFQAITDARDYQGHAVVDRICEQYGFHFKQPTNQEEEKDNATTN